MRRLFILSSLAIALSGGIALANPSNHGGRSQPTFSTGHGPAIHSGWSGGRTYGGNSSRSRYWSGGVNVRPSPVWNGGSHGYVGANRGHEVIYGQRPVVHERYFNYYQRPQLIAESYAARPGYYWVAGSWQWDGYEWLWQPGHYEPNPAYAPYAPY